MPRVITEESKHWVVLDNDKEVSLVVEACISSVLDVMSYGLDGDLEVVPFLARCAHDARVYQQIAHLSDREMGDLSHAMVRYLDPEIAAHAIRRHHHSVEMRLELTQGAIGMIGLLRDAQLGLTEDAAPEAKAAVIEDSGLPRG